MATLKLGDTTYEVPAFNLDKLVDVADDIDSVNDTITKLGSDAAFKIKTILGAYRPILNIAATGLAPNGPTTDELMAAARFTDDGAIFGFFNAFLIECGLRALGEGQAAPVANSAVESSTSQANGSANSSEL